MENAQARLLFDLERKLLEPAVRADQEALKLLLSPDFFEYGSSGRIWNRAQLIEALATEEATKATASDFSARELADGVVLVTFKTSRADAGQRTSSLRSSIWKREAGNWQLVFHQGTRTVDS